MRYFGPSFFLIYILIGHLINLILIKNLKFGVILCILICLNYLYFSVEKISILLNVKKIINNKFVEFKIFDNYLNKNSIYISENMIYRENIKTLESYKSLLEKKIVSLNPDSDGKNSLNEIKKKIRIVKRAAKNDISPSSKNYVFYSKEYLVDDVDKLIDFFQLNFDYVIIKDSNKKLTSILQTRFEIENIFTASGIETLRSLTKHLENEFNPEKLKNITHLGSTMIVFKLK